MREEVNTDDRLSENSQEDRYLRLRILVCAAVLACASLAAFLYSDRIDAWRNPEIAADEMQSVRIDRLNPHAFGYYEERSNAIELDSPETRRIVADALLREHDEIGSKEFKRNHSLTYIREGDTEETLLLRNTTITTSSGTVERKLWFTESQLDRLWELLYTKEEFKKVCMELPEPGNGTAELGISWQDSPWGYLRVRHGTFLTPDETKKLISIARNELSGIEGPEWARFLDNNDREDCFMSVIYKTRASEKVLLPLSKSLTPASCAYAVEVIQTPTYFDL